MCARRAKTVSYSSKIVSSRIRLVQPVRTIAHVWESDTLFNLSAHRILAGLLGSGVVRMLRPFGRLERMNFTMATIAKAGRDNY